VYPTAHHTELGQKPINLNQSQPTYLHHSLCRRSSSCISSETFFRQAPYFQLDLRLKSVSRKMRYIRFLKPPRLNPTKDPSKTSLSFLITITSDLGDTFLPYDVGLTAELCASPSGKPWIMKPVQWSAGMRSLSITLSLDSSRDYGSVQVRVGVGRNMGADEYSKLSGGEWRGVVSAWSAPFDLGKECMKLVERRFVSSKRREVGIWEETGESIARHLW
jgi:hypothetical protein